MSLLAAKNPGGTAFILDAATVNVGSGVTLAQILCEQSARACADNAYAARVTSLSASVR